MPSLAEKVRGGRRAAALGLWTFGVMNTASAHLYFLPREARPRVHPRWMKLWSGGLLKALNVREVLVTGPPPVAAGARLVVANHRSPVDIILMLRYFGGCVLSHADVADYPLLGAAARHGDTIFVDRDSTKSGVTAIRQIRARLKEGRTVIVFPEGTTHRGDEVHPFQEGAFAALRGLDVEVVPVGVSYEPGTEFFEEGFGEHMTRMIGRPFTPVGICIGPGRPWKGKRSELVVALRDEVQALVSRARAALTPT